MPLGVQIQDRVDVQVTLETSVSVPASLKKAALFIDQIPVMPDVRFLDVTRSDYAGVLGAMPIARAFAASYFAQKRVPQSLQIVRWAETGENAYWAAGLGADYDVDAWKAITSGKLKFSSGDKTEEVDGITFAAATGVEDVASILQTKIQAGDYSDVPSVKTATVDFDAGGRLVISFPALATGIITVVEASANGTDLFGKLDAANGVAVAATAAESIGDAVAALRDLDDTAYFYCMRSADMSLSDQGDYHAKVEDFARAVEPLEKLGVVLLSDPAVKAAGSSDILSKLQTFGFTRTMAIYFEKASARFEQCPDAAALAAVFPGNEGAISFAQVDLTGIAPSGFASPLSAGQTAIINGKGGNVIERVGGFTYLFDGLTLSGEELRIMYGRDWFVTQIRAEVFSYLMSVDLAAFDLPTISALTSIIRRYGEAAIARRILVDTEERPFVVNVPEPDSFTLLQRRSHKLEMLEAFSGYINSAVNAVQIVGVWAA